MLLHVVASLLLACSSGHESFSPHRSRSGFFVPGLDPASPPRCTRPLADVCRRESGVDRFCGNGLRFEALASRVERGGDDDCLSAAIGKCGAYRFASLQDEYVGITAFYDDTQTLVAVYGTTDYSGTCVYGRPVSCEPSGAEERCRAEFRRRH